jgi:hypothetical protein
MATITENRNFFKWPKLLYFKPESAPYWIQDGADGHTFERGPPKDHFSKVWLRLAMKLKKNLLL